MTFKLFHHRGLNATIIILLGVWTLVVYPMVLLFSGIYLHASDKIVEALATYMVGLVACPVVGALITLGKRKLKEKLHDQNS